MNRGFSSSKLSNTASFTATLSTNKVINSGSRFPLTPARMV